jgi:hypothetical protein
MCILSREIALDASKITSAPFDGICPCVGRGAWCTTFFSEAVGGAIKVVKSLLLGEYNQTAYLTHIWKLEFL